MEERRMSTDVNVVYIGRKPVMSYVLAIITGFNNTHASKVILRARGRAITTAVDAAEVTRRRFMQGLHVSSISIGTEELPQELGRTRAVSTMEITLTRPFSVNNKEEDKDRSNSVTPNQPIALTNIKGIGIKRAEKLRSCGVNSVQDIVNYDAQDLSEKLQVSEKTVSKWIKEAKKALKS
jgi:DNA-binding protein